MAVPDPVGAASAVERRAHDAGWRLRPYHLAGFLPAEGVQETGTLCRDGRSLNVLPIQTPESLIRIDLQENPSCQEQPGIALGPAFESIPLPVLKMPAGVLYQGGGTEGGGGYEGVSASLHSDLSADQLAAAFSEQANKAGWHPTRGSFVIAVPRQPSAPEP